MIEETEELVTLARETLRNNDLGGYTVPTHGLYPFQWNWDSAIVALGWLTFDEKRAWEEVISLVSAQWDNGMIPHVVFHKPSTSYFPGPDVWGSDKKIKSTSITQPPILATVVNRLFNECQDRQLAKEMTSSLISPLLNYHLWWYEKRDPDCTGLVVSYHPWESGMDNSPAWDKPLAAVPEVTWEYQRKDLSHIDSEQRPHKDEYDRFLYLVDFFKQNRFDDEVIFQSCPYKVNDIGIISILHRATKDLLKLCSQLNIHDSRIQTLSDRISVTEKSVSRLWNEETNLFHSKDILKDEFCSAKTTAGLLPICAGLVDDHRLTDMISQLSEWISASNYSLASTHPADPGYEPQRYWRGPVWIHINWLLFLGLNELNLSNLAEQIKIDSQKLIHKSGYCESFNSENGEQSGGAAFSWTAAMALYWLL